MSGSDSLKSSEEQASKAQEEQAALEEALFSIISHAGNARAKAYEALDLIAESKYDEARSKIEEAHDEITEAHRAHADLIRKEASGERIPASMLLMHSLDILMAAISESDLVERLISIFEAKEKKV
ncbi:MAG: PTS lactose/cellobiose transporter subunit IIA [Candidatus Asgardarchaeia archaeon]